MFRFAPKLPALRRRLRADSKGAVSIEFALIAPIFFLLLLGIIETGILFYSQSTLLFATQNAGRLVRTGSAQGTTYTSAAKVCTAGAGGSGAGGAYTNGQEWFKDEICCGISTILTDCSTALHVNVQNYTGGFGSNFTDTPDSSGYLSPVTDAYNPGVACDVVLVRATYSWTVVTPALTWFLSNMAGGKHLLSATTAFRNEPYTAGAVC